MTPRVLAFLIAWIAAAAAAQQALPLPAPPQQVQQRSASLSDGHECAVEPSLVVSVGSPVDGVLELVAVDRGAVVHKGQVVAKLQSNVEAAAVELSRGRIEFDRRKLERNETLFAKQLISAQERDEMATEARLHEGELKKELAYLNQRTIVSPIKGVVVERYLGPGEVIRADKSVVLRLAQLDPLNIEVITPASLFGSVKVGMKGVVNLAPLVRGQHRAEVVVVDKLIDAASGTFWVRLQLPNPDNRIPAGLRCTVRFSK